MVEGKYNDLASIVRISAEAEAVVLVVINGKDGSGFSVHAGSGINELLPTILRRVADDISGRSFVATVATPERASKPRKW
jgi:hypothetical protein